MTHRSALRLFAIALAASVQSAEASAQTTLQTTLLDCAYAPRGGGEMQTFNNCATKDAQGQVHLAPQRLSQLSYDSNKLAGVYVECWYYLARDGRSAAVVAFDNGPDPFADGLARSPVGDKVGYIDRHLRLVIPAQFDGAFPFEHGQAAVCVGCRATSDGEHSSYAGGQWGCIDRRGQLVTALHDAAGYVPCASPGRSGP